MPIEIVFFAFYIMCNIEKKLTLIDRAVMIFVKINFVFLGFRFNCDFLPVWVNLFILVSLNTLVTILTLFSFFTFPLQSRKLEIIVMVKIFTKKILSEM